MRAQVWKPRTSEIFLAFPCNEHGGTKHDRYDLPVGVHSHVWPIWDGLKDCSALDLTERNGSVSYAKAVCGHIDYHALGRKDMVTAHPMDHYLSIFSPILRDLGLYPGPAIYHNAPEWVSDNLRDATSSDRALSRRGT